MDYEVSPDYMPISPSALRTDTTVGCDIYILAKTSIEVRFVLYCKSDAVFDEEKKSMLLSKRIKKLFIKKGEKQAFFTYLENNFQKIVSDSSIPSDERTKIVHSSATNLVKDLFEDPRSGSIERTKTFANNMVDYVLKDNDAAHSLLKIAVHEYYTYTHSVNVAAVGTLFGKNIGLDDDELKNLCSGILMHDVGKTRISTDILNKKGKLTKEEFDEIKKHPELGIEVLDEADIEFKEAGVKLTVTPSIVGDGNIILNVKIEKKTAKTSDANPPIITREITTKLLIKDNTIVVIGGVFTQETVDSTNKVPFFGDIPILGQLFQYNKDSDVRKELLVFLAPRVI